jgi:hypothetical protein
LTSDSAVGYYVKNCIEPASDFLSTRLLYF